MFFCAGEDGGLDVRVDVLGSGGSEDDLGGRGAVECVGGVGILGEVESVEGIDGVDVRDMV